MIVRSCRAARLAVVAPGFRSRPFSTTPTLGDDPPNHYETLGLQLNASPGDVKKRFYALSKSHHPDLHPNDPDASSRFVKISEAYAVLGSAEKRASYDRTIAPAASHHHSHHRGSYSSHTASSPAGGRPPSGLSRRKTQFRGPPPSFYRSGGWGEHAAKRSEHAARGRTDHDSSSARQAGGVGADGASSSASHTEPGGMGPGGFAAGFDNDVPHFDRAGHFRTQESVQKMRHRSRRDGGWAPEEHVPDPRAGGSALGGFLVVTGVLAIALGLGAVFDGVIAPAMVEPPERRRRHDG